jgi:hypothetical protein
LLSGRADLALQSAVERNAPIITHLGKVPEGGTRGAFVSS